LTVSLRKRGTSEKNLPCGQISRGAGLQGWQPPVPVDYLLTSFVGDPVEDVYTKSTCKSGYGLLVLLFVSKSGIRDPLGGFKGHRLVRLAAVYVLFQSLTQTSLAWDFHKTKIPQHYAAGLICGLWRRKRDSNLFCKNKIMNQI